MTKKKQAVGQKATIRVFTIDDLLKIHKNDWKAKPLANILSRHREMVDLEGFWYDCFEEQFGDELSEVGLRMKRFRLDIDSPYAIVEAVLVEPVGKIPPAKEYTHSKLMKGWKRRLSHLHTLHKEYFEIESTSKDHISFASMEVELSCICDEPNDKAHERIEDIFIEVLVEINAHYLKYAEDSYDYCVSAEACKMEAQDNERLYLESGDYLPHGVELDKTAKVC